MKKLVTLFGAIILGFTIISCSTPNPKDTILKEANEFFAQAETELQAIDNAEDLLHFIKVFDIDREEFGQALDEKYPKDENGIFKGMNADEMDAMFTAISERATEYNHLEYAKCGEIMEPYIARIEKAANALYEDYLAGNDVNDELVDEYLEGIDALQTYSDIVPEELADRYFVADSLMYEMFGEEDEF